MSTQQALNYVALIGGMGPEAGADALTRFLAACRRELENRRLEVADQAYPPHVLVQFPVADRSEALLRGGESPLPGIVNAFSVARSSGARVFGIACNTAHFWHGELSRLFPDLDIIHIAQETAGAAQRSGARSCAVMATLATQRGRLYHEALIARGIEVAQQDESELARTHEAIFAVKAGRPREAQRLLQPQLDGLLARADAVVLGCTELGLVLDPGTLPAGRVIDAADVLAGALAAKAYGTYFSPTQVPR
jgi:aspartate racemase